VFDIPIETMTILPPALAFPLVSRGVTAAARAAPATPCGSGIRLPPG
jgi:hypothetical protein